MRLNRRALLAAPALLPGLARAAAWPNKPVRIVVAYPPGGPVDTQARLIAPRLEARWGQPVVIENRPGNAGNVGALAVARAAPDGHTLLICASSHAINPGMYRNMPFDTARDFAPCSLLTAGAFILTVHPSVPARTVPAFIAYAKANPDKLNYSSAGSGTGNHLAAELFKQMAGVEMVHIPFSGAAPANTAVISGQAPVMFNNMISAMQHMPDSRMFGLGVTTLTRARALPQVPAIAEFLPGYDVSGWYGLLTTAGTPAAITEEIHQAASAAMAVPAVTERIEALGLEVAHMGPAQFSSFITAEMVKWARVVEIAKAQVD